MPTLQPESSHDMPIALRDVGKIWPARFTLRRRVGLPARTVLAGIDLSVPRASCTALLGRNGAGKTTLLKVIAGLASYTGDLRLCGAATPSGLSRARRMHLAYSGGERGFYFRLSVRHNLEFFGRLEGLRFRSLRDRISDVLGILDLEAQADRSFAELSSGQRQRVAIARALLKRPKVLLLDEPTRMLDPVYAQALQRFIREQLVERDEKTVLVATNVVDEALAIGDRFALIEGGRIHHLSGENGHAVDGTVIADAFERITA